MLTGVLGFNADRDLGEPLLITFLGVVLPGVVLPGVVLPGVVLPGVVLPGVVLPGVVLPGVVLPGVVLPGVVLPGVVLPGVFLPRATGGDFLLRVEEAFATTDLEKILELLLGVAVLVVLLVVRKAVFVVGVFPFLKGVIFLIFPAKTLGDDFFFIVCGLFLVAAIYIYFFIKC